MRKEFLDQYVLEIYNHSMNPIKATRDEIQGLRKVLEDLPLDIEPDGKGHIRYFPEGGTSSANIPHLIRIEATIDRIVRTDDNLRKSKPGSKKVEFVYFSKCLCLRYRIKGKTYTLEISSKP